MQQWITALEKMAKDSHWAGSNRFSSFAPIRLNVAAQWLVDGVSSSSFFFNAMAQRFLTERLYVESFTRYSPCKGPDIYSRLVAITW